MPTLNESELASRYGWSQAVLNSDPELANLFRRAVSETWTSDKFTAELRSTGWFQRNSDTVRQSILLEQTDPATYNSRIDQRAATVTRMASATGAVITPDVVRQVARDSVRLGWNDDQINAQLGTYVKRVAGNYYGKSQQYATEIREYAQSMGVRLDEKTLETWVRQIALTGGDASSAKGSIMGWAQSAYPQFNDRIQAGETIDQIASPYKQSMATLLELNPETIDNFNPTVRTALSAKGADGKPASQSLWEFENTLRKDPRWMKTKNAQDAAMGTTRQVLQDMGVLGG